MNTCRNCGYNIYEDEYSDRWVHEEGIAVCPTATYAAPVQA